MTDDPGYTVQGDHFSCQPHPLFTANTNRWGMITVIGCKLCERHADFQIDTGKHVEATDPDLVRAVLRDAPENFSSRLRSILEQRLQRLEEIADGRRTW